MKPDLPGFGAVVRDLTAVYVEQHAIESLSVVLFQLNHTCLLSCVSVSDVILRGPTSRKLTAKVLFGPIILLKYAERLHKIMRWYLTSCPGNLTVMSENSAPLYQLHVPIIN